MFITVNKFQDGNIFITKDPFGELFSGDVEVDAPPTTVSADAIVAIATRERYDEEYLVGVFSWVDYKDTSTIEPSVAGVRHTAEWFVPGGYVFGPYTVLAVEDE